MRKRNQKSQNWEPLSESASVWASTSFGELTPQKIQFFTRSSYCFVKIHLKTRKIYENAPKRYFNQLVGVLATQIHNSWNISWNYFLLWTWKHQLKQSSINRGSVKLLGSTLAFSSRWKRLKSWERKFFCEIFVLPYCEFSVCVWFHFVAKCGAANANFSQTFSSVLLIFFAFVKFQISRLFIVNKPTCLGDLPLTLCS